MNQKTILRTVLIAVLSLVATAATAHDFEVGGIYYNKTGNVTVSVTYEGSSYNNAEGYTDDVEIPSSVTYSGKTYSVTSIGNNAFYYCSDLTSVTIPNSVKSIGSSAFWYCSGLKSVTIPNSVTSIGNSAFSGCRGLTSVTIGNSVSSIGNYVFDCCSGLTSVTIPNSVKSIGNLTFRGCSGLKSVTIPNSVTSIGSSAFRDCSGLTSVTIGNSVSSIGEEAFYRCSGLTSIIVDSENQIYDSRENCNAIIEKASNKLLYGCKKTIIPNSVTSIGNYAFYYCSGLTSVTIPNSVSSIGEDAFCGCSGLTSVISKAVIPPTCGSYAFDDTYSATLIVPSVAKEAYKAASIWSNFNNYAEPDNKITAIAINHIEANLFINNTLQLSATVTPEDATFADVLQWTSSNPEVATVDDNGLVTAIAKGDAEIKVMTCDGSNLSASCTIKVALSTSHNFDVGGIYYKFNGKGTVEVTFKGSSYDEYAHEYTGNVEIPSSVTYSGTTYSVTSIGNNAFNGCSGLTSVTIPNSVKSIGDYAFNGCSGLKSITIPNSVKSIGDYAFSNCSGLTSVTIGNSVTSIGNKAFYGCSGLTSVTIPNSVTSIGGSAFSGCSGLKSITIPNSVKSIGDYAFYCCSGLTSVTIGNSVPSIGNKAFYGCSGLTSVTIPNSVTSILDYAFYGCSGLTSVTIPNSVKSIGDNAFNGCSGLTIITIPNSVTSISSHVFSGCSGLTSVTIPNSVKSIGFAAFYGCSGLTSVTIPNSVKSIGYAAFSGCSGLTSVTIPNSVSSIGGSAFNGCSGLTSVTIGNSVKSIDYAAFSGCSGLTSVISKAVTPPVCPYEVFSTETYSVPLIVPSIAKAAYTKASPWSKFSNYAEPDNKITAIAINNNEANLFIDNTLQLSATVTPEDATFADVLQWTSRDPEVATVDDNGLVTGITKGNAEIIATTCDGSNLSASYIIKVAVPTAFNFEVDGICYEFSGTGKVSVINRRDYSGAYDGYSGNVVIPSSVTFQETPYSVTSIGQKAFEGCSGLTSVTIPNSVTSIGYLAFDGCSGLTSVTIPNSVTVIGVRAFSYCSGLKSVTIGNSVSSIGFGAFMGCSGLTSVTIPNSVTSIGNYAFSECSRLTSVTIGNSVTSIGKDAFLNCSGLTSITIPNSVTSIGDYAFDGCSGLTSVSIGNSVTSLGDYAFLNCSGLTSIKVDSENKIYDSREDCNAIIKKATNTLHTGCKNTIIPNSVSSIGNGAFGGCSGLTSITIPNSVTVIGDQAFVDCSGLTSVNIPNSVTSIGEYAFDGCSGLTSVISKAFTPPTCGSDVFSTETYSKPLIVPSVAKEAYKAASIWSNFSNYAEPVYKITAIAINNNEANLVIGNTLQLTAKVTPEDATFADVLQWESSNPAVATVDDEGLVTTLAPGSTVITATSCDGSNISATCTVVVCQKAANVNELVEGANIVGFGLQGVKMHNGVLYACTTAESVNMSTPTLHGNNANNMAPYEDRNFDEFDQRDWVAIRGLGEGFVGKELSYPFVANFADGVLTPSETIKATADATAYTLNTFRAENILHGGYSNYVEGDYTAYYVPARVYEVAKFMGLIETVGGVKYLYSNNAYGRTGGEGIKVENCTIEDNSKVYSLLEGILVADDSTEAGVKIIMLKDLGQATGVEGVDSAAARIYSANGNIIIAAAEDGEAAVYDFTGRLIKSVPIVAGDNTAVPVMPGCYIVRTGVKTQSVVVK